MGSKKEYAIFLDDLFENRAARANYTINWSKKYRYIYVETPKVACTTIKRVLQNAEVMGDETALAERVHDRQNSPIPKVSDDLEGFKGLLANPNTFTFCFVRNPYTRVLSCYLDKMVRTEFERNRLAPSLNLQTETAPEFLDFLKAVKDQPEIERDIHWTAQTFLLRPDKMAYSFIGRFENFNAHFNAVCDHLSVLNYYTPKPVGHATNANERVTQFLGPEEVELIQDIYADDFKNFGYGVSPDIC